MFMSVPVGILQRHQVPLLGCFAGCDHACIGTAPSVPSSMRLARAYPGRIFELSNFENVEKSHLIR